MNRQIQNNFIPRSRYIVRKILCLMFLLIFLFVWIFSMTLKNKSKVYDTYHNEKADLRYISENSDLILDKNDQFNLEKTYNFENKTNKGKFDKTCKRKSNITITNRRDSKKVNKKESNITHEKSYAKDKEKLNINDKKEISITSKEKINETGEEEIFIISTSDKKSNSTKKGDAKRRNKNESNITDGKSNAKEKEKINFMDKKEIITTSKEKLNKIDKRGIITNNTDENNKNEAVKGGLEETGKGKRIIISNEEELTITTGEENKSTTDEGITNTTDKDNQNEAAKSAKKEVITTFNERTLTKTGKGEMINTLNDGEIANPTQSLGLNITDKENTKKADYEELNKKFKGVINTNEEESTSAVDIIGSNTADEHNINKIYEDNTNKNDKDNTNKMEKDKLNEEYKENINKFDKGQFNKKLKDKLDEDKIGETYNHLQQLNRENFPKTGRSSEENIELYISNINSILSSQTNDLHTNEKEKEFQTPTKVIILNVGIFLEVINSLSDYYTDMGWVYEINSIDLSLFTYDLINFFSYESSNYISNAPLLSYSLRIAIFTAFSIEVLWYENENFDKQSFVKALSFYVEESKKSMIPIMDSKIVMSVDSYEEFSEIEISKHNEINELYTNEFIDFCECFCTYTALLKYSVEQLSYENINFKDFDFKKKFNMRINKYNGIYKREKKENSTPTIFPYLLNISKKIREFELSGDESVYLNDIDESDCNLLRNIKGHEYLSRMFERIYGEEKDKETKLSLNELKKSAIGRRFLNFYYHLSKVMLIKPDENTINEEIKNQFRENIFNLLKSVMRFGEVEYMIVLSNYKRPYVEQEYSDSFESTTEK